MIEVDGLVKIFSDRKRGEVRAVDGICFEVNPGEIFGLLGLNGAGKTTTLRMLATILTPTAGTAKVDGYDICENPVEVRRRVGFLSGDTGLYHRLTPRELLNYFGELYGMDKKRIDDRMEELSTLLDMGGFLDVKIDKLSQGMKQKTSIARTLMHDPQVLLLDEPIKGLDVLTSLNIIEFIRNSKRMGKTIVFSTHVMREAERLCDR
ncbi:ABC transporter ATP-binding protein, partial [candidate division bacterium WOR-3 4484_18]